jgi:membrane-bound lytic murein transglycosylase D
MKSAEAARRVGLPEAEFRNVNGIPGNVLIKAGSTLLAPRPAHKEEDVATHVADNGQILLGPDVVLRRTLVKAGKAETVASLARRYKLAPVSVAEWNKVSASAAFRAGQQVVVFLPVRSGQEAARGGAKSATKTARRGGKPVRTARR